MNDPLFQVCLDYAKEIDSLKFNFYVMTGLMLLWMLIAVVEYSVLKVYTKGDEKDV